MQTEVGAIFRRQVQRYVNDLLEAGVLERIGSGLKVVYRVVPIVFARAFGIGLKATDYWQYITVGDRWRDSGR